MKPDWKDAPEWAQYLAQDGDGDWWWYEQQPYWRPERDRWGCTGGRNMSDADHKSSSPEYTLERRP